MQRPNLSIESDLEGRKIDGAFGRDSDDVGADGLSTKELGGHYELLVAVSIHEAPVVFPNLQRQARCCPDGTKIASMPPSLKITEKCAYCRAIAASLEADSVPVCFALGK